jgi:hypothetical protein
MYTTTITTTTRTAAAKSIPGAVTPVGFVQVGICQFQSNRASQGQSIPIAIAGSGGTAISNSTQAINQRACLNGPRVKFSKLR